MWVAEHTIVTNTSRESVWKAWADVEGWPKWDQGVEWCRLDGEFKTGTSYALKPKGGPEAKAVITDCQPLIGFSDVTQLPLAKMEFIHELAEQADGVHVTHRVNISGLLGFFFVQMIGKDTARDLPETMGNLLRVAKELK
jgi:hypothetical protein